MWTSRVDPCHHPPLCHVHFRRWLVLWWLKMANISLGQTFCVRFHSRPISLQQKLPLSLLWIYLGQLVTGTLIPVLLSHCSLRGTGVPAIHTSVLRISKLPFNTKTWFPLIRVGTGGPLECLFIFGLFCKDPSFYCKCSLSSLEKMKIIHIVNLMF